MSSGRKKRTAKVNAKGVKNTDLLANLTMVENGGNTNLANSWYRGKKKAMNWSGAKNDLERERDQNFLPTVTQLSDDQITSLNVRFQQRAGEILQRNTFQGRNQLILTDRA